MARTNVSGTVYIIHFSRPFGHARHYVGWTEGEDVAARMACHRSGRGSALMRAVTRAGIDWEVVHTQPGTRDDERRIKRRKCTPDICPVCRGRQAPC